ncbi:MAG: hypothetical protein OEY01_08050 [Desulfobulbaceae bacterium]|nr:hypothetical protein [Desulfobulbaceae bacterium]
MDTPILQPQIAAKIAAIYERMEKAYDIVAKQLDFSCEGCPDNCCDSFFQHHTYIEWAYLWEGLNGLPAAKLAAIRERAEEYVAATERAAKKGEHPRLLCPLIEDGLCGLYQHRLMICRLHGVPSSITFPNGQVKKFPGCFRCQELKGEREVMPMVERASLLRDLALLEQEFMGANLGQMPKLKKTIAEMIILGPPRL